eukprot:1430103-Amphidinium_carterae.1
MAFAFTVQVARGMLDDFEETGVDEESLQQATIWADRPAQNAWEHLPAKLGEQEHTIPPFSITDRSKY